MVRRNATARYERRVAGLVAGEIVCAPSDKAFIRDRSSTRGARAGGGQWH